jgi:hypothetical protein
MKSRKKEVLEAEIGGYVAGVFLYAQKIVRRLQGKGKWVGKKLKKCTVKIVGCGGVWRRD